MSLEALPYEILKKIFMLLPFEDVNRCRLVSRRCYQIIEENVLSMNGVTTNELYIKCYRDASNEEKYDLVVDLDYIKNDEIISIILKSRKITVYSASGLFRWLRFNNKMEALDIEAYNVTGIFPFLTKYFKRSRPQPDHVGLYIDKCPVNKSFTEFLTSMDYTDCCLVLKNLDFSPRMLTIDYEFPSCEYLSRLIVKDNISSVFLSRPFLEKVFEQNKRLKEIIVYGMKNILDEDTMENVFQTMKSISDNDCSRHILDFRFETTSTVKFMGMLRKFYSGNQYHSTYRTCDCCDKFEAVVKNFTKCPTCKKRRFVRYNLF
uniref:F-box domain-containing protein n=1 Tax=Parastrongyloides trichosuri TaxID=131310 RepID=A0A0N4Z3M0_PARTI